MNVLEIYVFLNFYSQSKHLEKEVEGIFKTNKNVLLIELYFYIQNLKATIVLKNPFYIFPIS